MVFSVALLLGVFQNCSDSSNISQSDQKSTSTPSPSPSPSPGPNPSTSKASCPGMNVASCVLPTTDHAGLAGSCASGTSGTCSYQCNDGFWGQLYNNCAPAPCAATTINGCSLGAANSGTSTGSCIAADHGGCSATCNNGNWNVTANTCAPKVLTCAFTQSYKYYFMNDGATLAPTNSTSSTDAGCLTFCQNSGAALCQYFWVNSVYYCQAFSPAAAAQTYLSDFASPSAVGSCSYQ